MRALQATACCYMASSGAAADVTTYAECCLCDLLPQSSSLHGTLYSQPFDVDAVFSENSRAVKFVGDGCGTGPGPMLSPLVERCQRRASQCVRGLTAFDRALEGWLGRGAKPNPPKKYGVDPPHDPGSKDRVLPSACSYPTATPCAMMTGVGYDRRRGHSLCTGCVVIVVPDDVGSGGRVAVAWVWAFPVGHGALQRAHKPTFPAPPLATLLFLLSVRGAPACRPRWRCYCSC